MPTSEERKSDRSEHAEARWLITDIQRMAHLTAPILEKDSGMQKHFEAVLTATGETIREKLKNLCQYVLELKQKFLAALDRTLPPDHPELKEGEKEAVKRRMHILSTATNVLIGVFHAIREIAERCLASPLDVEDLLAATAKKYASVRLSYDAEVRETGAAGF